MRRPGPPLLTRVDPYAPWVPFIPWRWRQCEACGVEFRREVGWRWELTEERVVFYEGRGDPRWRRIPGRGQYERVRCGTCGPP